MTEGCIYIYVASTYMYVYIYIYVAYMHTVFPILSEHGTSLAEIGIQTFKMGEHRNHTPEVFEINPAATVCLSCASK